MRKLPNYKEVFNISISISIYMQVSGFRSLSCHSAHTQRQLLWLVLSKGISKAWHHSLHSHTNHINFILYGVTTGQEHKWLQWFCTANSALLKLEACTCYCLLSLGSHSHPSAMWNSPRQTTASILQNLLDHAAYSAAPAVFTTGNVSLLSVVFFKWS